MDGEVAPAPARRKRVWAALRDVLIFVGVLIGVNVVLTRDLVSGRAPRFHARALDERPVEVPATDARPRMVHFFATWCGVCRAEEHNLRALGDSGELVLIASDSGSAEAVRSYAREHGLTMPVIYDDGTLKRAYRVSSYPTSFFVDARGEISSVSVGYTTELGMRLRLRAAR